MDVARLTGLDDQADLGAGAFADQVMVHARGHEQAWDRRVLAVDASVGEDDHRHAVRDRLDASAQRRSMAAFMAPGPFAGWNRVEMVRAAACPA